ncbi:class I lanthipeptide [Kordia sp.]|uniref:class I lanthipeptide n=1 Tax=Kordia sp. TaxID=1965332 RepID=UPI003D6A40F1
MKKKQFTSKLQFQKTTVVSFEAMENIVAGALVNTDTIPISNNILVCLTFTVCQTQDNGQTCLSCTDTECTRPTNTGSKITEFCGADTRVDCLDTRGC